MTEKVNAIIEILKDRYADAPCALHYKKDYELMIAVRLSAQCTDERVNKVTPALFEKYPDKAEGELTKLRASLVSEKPLAAVARQIGLGEFLFLGHGEERTGGRDRDSVTSDAVEALLGAIYLDGGMACAKRFAIKFILNDIENKQLFHDSKTILQELIQKYHKGELKYELIKDEGPDHEKNYGVNALIDGKIAGYGEGRTKKAAEQEAAYNAIKSLKN